MDLLEFVQDIPHVSSHEHIGAFSPIGFKKDKPYGSLTDHYPGKNFDYPPKLFDLLSSPYMGYLLSTINKDGSIDYKNWSVLKNLLIDIRATGLYQALNEGLAAIYGTSLDNIVFDDININDIDFKIGSYYKNGFFESVKEVFQSLNVEKVIKPIHINYLYLNPIDTDEYDIERKLFQPVLRVDDFFGIMNDYGVLDWSYLYNVMNIEINSISDIDNMIDKGFEKAVGKKLIGIKQLQAYNRSLQFDKTTSKKCEIDFNRMKNGDISAALNVQNYIMHVICERANDLKLPYQIHAGMASLNGSNPGYLENVIKMYKEINFVLLHCYPYVDEGNYLARQYGNVYVDTAWLCLQSTSTLNYSLHKYIGFLPASKILMSCDATNLEEFAGALINSRKTAVKVMQDKVNDMSLDFRAAKDYLYKMFRGNALNLYNN